MPQKLIKSFYWRYHRLRNLWPVWLWLNRKSRGHFLHHCRDLDHIENRILRELEKDGVYTVLMSELFPGHFFEELREYTAGLLKNPPKQSGVSQKDFFIFLLGDEGESSNPLDLSNGFVRLSLNDKILQIIGRYLGSSPKFNSFSLRATTVVPDGSRPHLSQRWHRDPDDKKMVKVFLYLTDVLNQGAGPFMYVKGSHFGGKWRNLYPQIPPVGSYPPDGAVEKVVPKEDIKVCLAPAGTLIFADTSGLHRGGYSTTETRLMSVSDFLSSASLQKPRYKISDDVVSTDISPLARYSLQWQL